MKQPTTKTVIRALLFLGAVIFGSCSYMAISDMIKASNNLRQSIVTLRKAHAQLVAAKELLTEASHAWIDVEATTGCHWSFADRDWDCSEPAMREKWNESVLAGYGTSSAKVFKATVTAYAAVPEQTDASPCIAASGMDICQLNMNLGTLGVDSICASNDFPFGTKLLINGQGTCMVLDRMNARYTAQNRIDLFAGSALEASLFGLKRLAVMRLSP